LQERGAPVSRFNELNNLPLSIVEGPDGGWTKGTRVIYPTTAETSVGDAHDLPLTKKTRRPQRGQIHIPDSLFRGRFITPRVIRKATHDEANVPRSLRAAQGGPVAPFRAPDASYTVTTNTSPAFTYPSPPHWTGSTRLVRGLFHHEVRA